MAGEKAEWCSTKGKKSIKFTLQHVLTRGQVTANFSALEEQESGRRRCYSPGSSEQTAVRLS